jgi:hypothetical protein
MNGRASGLALNADSLRERNVPVRARTEDDARKAVLELNAYEERTQKDEQNRKTYGRTPEGIGLSSPQHQEIYLSSLRVAHAHTSVSTKTTQSWPRLVD